MIITADIWRLIVGHPRHHQSWACGACNQLSKIVQQQETEDTHPPMPANMTMHQRLELTAQILVSSGHEALARDVRDASDMLAERVPHWGDVPAALRDLAPVAPAGLTPLMLQAANEIDALRSSSPAKSVPYTKAKRFTIHPNDAGCEAYCDDYVRHLEARPTLPTDGSLIPVSDLQAAAAHIEKLEAALDDACKSCACSLRERESGHRVGCNVPEWRELLKP